MGHKIIDRDICSSKDCKLKIYCAREERDRSRRSFSRVNTGYSCREPGETRRRSYSKVTFAMLRRSCLELSSSTYRRRGNQKP